MKNPVITLVHSDKNGMEVESRRYTYSDGYTPPNKHLPIEPYKQLTDVPVPLRHTIRRAHESGLTIEHLTKIFDLPVEWVQRFVADPGLD